MRRTLAALVVAALAVAALGQDKAKAPPAPKVVSESEWWQLYDKAVKDAKTTLEKAERAKLLFEKIVIECRGKIRDIAPAGSAEPPQVSIHVCSIGGGDDMRTFTLPKDSVKGWEQWDRLTWRVRPSLSANGEIAFTDFVAPPAPQRFPDPGVEPAELGRPQGSARDLFDVTVRFARASYFEHRENAETIWDEACSASWVCAATVVTPPGSDNRARVCLDFAPLIYAIANENHPKAQPTFATSWNKDYGEKPIRSWGLPADIQVRVLDPQLAPLVRAGDRVEVVFEFADADRERAKQGLFPVAGRLWKDPKAARRKS